MSTAVSELDSLVHSNFAVSDSFQLPEGEMEYKVAYTPDSKQRFSELRLKVAPLGFTPWLTGSKDECILTLRKTQLPGSRQSRVPTIMALLSLVSIISFSLLEKTLYGKFAPNLGGVAVIVSYSLCVVAILSVHEAGHRYAARRTRELPPISYVIPGIPGVTTFLPAIGPLSAQKGPAVNRDGLFDVAIWGPLAAFILTLVLSVTGEFNTVQSSIPLQGNQAVNSFVSVNFFNPSAIQYALDALFAPLLSQAPAGFVVLSPVADAASVGFFLTFLGLLPISSFDGGLVSWTVWGAKASRLATYVSAFVLISFDTLNYFAIAIFIILISGRQLKVQFLDEVSAISPRRKWVYGGALALAFLCVPLPQLPWFGLA